MTPTPEQSAIVLAATSTSDNLLISALAGAAKTSTLVLLAQALPIPTTAISFNSRIAKEMKDRLPAHCESMTLNSLGYRTWTANIGRRAPVDERKTYRLVREAIEEVKDTRTKGELWGRMADLMKEVDWGKTAGWVPDAYTGTSPMGKAAPLMSDDQYYAGLDEEPTKAEWDLLYLVAVRSLDEALGRRTLTMDFSDQLLMPTVFPVSFNSPPLVLVDEAQDLSPLNHAMLKKFARRRLIAVGDECQSIYGFRGADQQSMATLEQAFSMRRLVLSVSFRCPIAVVEAARWRAPHMQYPEWAAPGQVQSLPEWTAQTVPDDGVILCRNNAPLFSTAIKLLKNLRFPELVGNDIGKTMVKWLKKLGEPSMTQKAAFAAIIEWEKGKLLKSRSPGKVRDQADCLRVFVKEGPTLGAAIAYAEKVLSMGGPVKLMTIHKSKGLEFNHVFILDEELIGDDQQDKNLRYVAITRAKETLTYITSEGFRGKGNDDADAGME
jgi:DNA helicase II / ATP-dependent DNA helicase PcrA